MPPGAGPKGSTAEGAGRPPALSVPLLLLALLFAGAALGMQVGDASSGVDEILAQAIPFICDQLAATGAALGLAVDKFPNSTDQQTGQWQTTDATTWTAGEGFWVPRMQALGTMDAAAWPAMHAGSSTPLHLPTSACHGTRCCRRPPCRAGYLSGCYWKAYTMTGDPSWADLATAQLPGLTTFIDEVLVWALAGLPHCPALF